MLTQQTNVSQLTLMWWPMQKWHIMSVLTIRIYIEFANNSLYMIGKDVSAYLVKNETIVCSKIMLEK